LTKIKIIGDPGQSNLETIKSWVEEYLKKFNLDCQIYLAFIENIEQYKRIIYKYGKLPNLFPKDLQSLIELGFNLIRSVGLLHEKMRKPGVPPIILIRKNSKVLKIHILDEIAHIKEDLEGWSKIKLEALNLLFQDFISPKNQALLHCFRIHIIDFFANEMKCRYGLNKEVFEDAKVKLNDLIENFFPLKGESKIGDFTLVLAASFLTTLPPSYPSRRQDEEELEKMIIDYIQEMLMDSIYWKIKSILSKLNSTPGIANIYEIGSEIIELAQEFLEK
jgi:hypothetical protein